MVFISPQTGSKTCKMLMILLRDSLIVFLKTGQVESKNNCVYCRLEGLKKEISDSLCSFWKMNTNPSPSAWPPFPPVMKNHMRAIKSLHSLEILLSIYSAFLGLQYLMLVVLYKPQIPGNVTLLGTDQGSSRVRISSGGRLKMGHN